MATIKYTFADGHSEEVEVTEEFKREYEFLLIWKMLKAGYLEDWKYNSTYSGTPQGGIISPLFANIYLHELDKFVAQLSKNFFSQPDARRAPEYRAIEHKLYKTSKEINVVILPNIHV